MAFLAALVLFIPIFRDLWGRAGRTWPATTALVAGVAGAACMFAQFAIDVVIGFMAADRAAMGPLFDQVRAVPGVRLAVYEAGPYLFNMAQLALVVLLAVQGRVKAWMPVVLLAGLVLPLAGRDLIPVGAVVVLLVFRPLARQSAAGRAGRAPAHA
ncbi:MAG TPA: hypothetical protein VFV66_21795 [Nonomuraea sp.]|nr:hypothetical protein [Nonomuraea sp.]